MALPLLLNISTYSRYRDEPLSDDFDSVPDTQSAKKQLSCARGTGNHARGSLHRLLRIGGTCGVPVKEHLLESVFPRCSVFHMLREVEPGRPTRGKPTRGKPTRGLQVPGRPTRGPRHLHLPHGTIHLPSVLLAF